MLAISAVLFALVFALTLWVDDPRDAPALLMLIPITLLALEFGPGLGLAAGLLAFGLFVVSVEIGDQQVNPLGYYTRAVVLVGCGPLLGSITARIRRRESRARSILETSHEAFIAMDGDGLITDWNSAAETALGWKKAEVVGRRLGDTLVPAKQRAAHAQGLRRYLDTGEPRVLNKVLEMSALHRDGHEVPMEFTIAAVDEGPTVSFYAFMRDITERVEAALEREKLLAKVQAMARTDELTGLPNRRAWEEEIRRELARARREEQPLSVAMLDLDGFKIYNDEHGHQAGDRLLMAAAAAWRLVLREVDFIARYGGEEFAVVLPGCLPAEAAVVVARLRAVIPDEQTCTAGIASLRKGETAESLVHRADSALYEGKDAGRDRTVISQR
ncbi:MAG: GGDEF domain-containing protein [Solirubrobacterales bacterium]